ncbi:MAG: class I SAM-dependent methyltransferase [Dehalococcoidia bacterium]
MKTKGKWVRSMRQDWDERAQRDPYYYIACRDPIQSDLPTFFESGEQDYVSLVQPVLSSLKFDPTERKALELGCGVGRMTRSFARRFDHVYAVDVSPEMISRARSLNQRLPNVAWHVVNGADLNDFPDGTVDLVFSYLVFQHVPEREIVMSNIGEVLRVLKEGGVYLFQFNSSSAPTMNWKGRLVWGIIDRWRSPLMARLLRVDPLAAGRTWHGAVLDQNEVLEQIWAHGGTVAGVRGVGTPATWCWGVRV